MRHNYIKISKMKDKGFKIITFKTTEGDNIYPVTVNEKEKFKKAIVRLKTQFPKFKNAKINNALLKGNDLMKEENRQSQIKDLGINDDDIIVIWFTQQNI